MFVKSNAARLHIRGHDTAPSTVSATTEPALLELATGREFASLSLDSFADHACGRSASHQNRPIVASADQHCVQSCPLQDLQRGPQIRVSSGAGNGSDGHHYLLSVCVGPCPARNPADLGRTDEPEQLRATLNQRGRAGALREILPGVDIELSLIHISEPTRLGMIS